MRTETIKIYQFDELSDSAKETARDWWRQGGLDHEWWDSVYDDFEQITQILGIELNTKPVPLMNGKTRNAPSIYFSGFCSQGDGACFEGSYYYAKGAAKKIREYAPVDETLHNIADNLQEIQRRYFYQLSATVKHSGHYYHEHCTDISVYNENGDFVDADTHDAIAEELRNLMQWLYRALEREYEYLNSDESVDETIILNEYEFTEDGHIA